MASRRPSPFPDPITRVERLLDPARLPRTPELRDGYLDAVAEAPPADGVGPRLMRSGLYPRVYQRIRPIGLRVMSGLTAPGRDADRAVAVQRLALEPGDTVLDVACGPGNFTAHFGSIVGSGGLAVGLDASTTMLAQAVRDNSAGPVAYLRGDAAALPFRDGTFDAVSCFAALYLISDPDEALAEAARVLRPGGALAILTSYVGRRLPVRVAMRAGQLTSGVRAFGAHDITDTFHRLGLVDVKQEIAGVAQAVWAVKPG